MFIMAQENTSPKSRADVKVIALAVICIILAASLVGVIALYQPAAGNSDLQTQIKTKNDQIAALQSEISSLTAQLQSTSDDNVSEYAQEIAYINQQLTVLNNTLTDAYSNIEAMTQILSLELTAQLYKDVFVQSANSSTSVWNDQLGYPGYVLVQLESNSSTTYAAVQFTVGSTNLSFNQTIGLSGSAILPVVPNPPGTVTILIGNTNAADSNNVNATVTYYY
jgi:Skp family chaperone for outer membrane proteins